MPLGKICTRCFGYYEGDHCNCPASIAYRRADNRRRHAKQKQQGKDEPWWPPLRQIILQRDGYQCVQCGSTTNLIVDYIPGGKHTRNPDDYQTLCGSCSGRKDAPRATKSAGGARRTVT